jgi:hypothetical protein
VIWRTLALLGAALPWSDARAGEGLTAVPNLNGPEVMLYVSLPIGPLGLPRSFGLRIDRHSLPSMLPAATASAADLAGRRELVNLSMAAHEHLRLEVARRVSWDFSRRQFNLPTDLPSMTPRFTGPRGLPGLGAGPAHGMAASNALAVVATASFRSIPMASALPALP